MHSMGLAYNKDNEGSDYVNTTTGGSPPIDPGDAVVPGGCYVYKWLVDDASAPDAGLNSKMWSYHPYLSMYNDLNTGLSGPTIVYNRGKMDSTMSSNREFIFLFEIFDETLSWLAFENAQKKQLAAPANPRSSPYNGNVSCWKPQLINMPNVTLTSTQAPAFFTVNGWVYANNPAFEMCLDDNVIWYLYTMGQDTHVFHMHGDFFQYNGQNRASIQISSGMMMTLPMVARATGIWQVICHMTDHLSFGMEALYEVFIKRAGEGCPLDGK
jgi:FtsP/CotA-like multicopper oxidase with cupredoxin domain